MKKRTLNTRTRVLVLGIIMISLAGIFLSINLANADSSGSTYCAEVTTYNATCQNVPLSQVNQSFAYAPTSCQYTSFCKTGTCVDTNSGNCMPNTASYTCSQSKGTVWYDATTDNVPLCTQGCCLIGDQAAFVTQARCRQLSTQYSLNATFRSDITNEAACLANAQPQAKGACVYQTSAGRTCKFTTKQDCQNMKASGLQNVDFHANYLCTNPDLGTNCAPTGQTTCVPGKDQVYFLDSCGNTANFYDASMFKSRSDYNISYWSYIAGTNGVALEPVVTASTVTTNGNCNYYSGTTCRQYDRSLDPARPQTGNYLCRNLNCSLGSLAVNFKNTYGYFPQNGETWCGTVNSSDQLQLGSNPGLGGTSVNGTGGVSVSSINKSANLPGSEDARYVCYNGQITIEPCAGYRQQICQQTRINTGGAGVLAASCVVNRWRDCYTQTSNSSCLDTSKRDCTWVVGVSILKDSNGLPLVMNKYGSLVPQANATDPRVGASCVPKYTPGLSASEAQQVCNIASTNCIVTFSNSSTGKQVASPSGSAWNNLIRSASNSTNYKITCFNDNGTIAKDWLANQTNICYALGDCGISPNYLGGSGINTERDLYTVITGNQTNSSSGSTSGTSSTTGSSTATSSTSTGTTTSG